MNNERYEWFQVRFFLKCSWKDLGFNKRAGIWTEEFLNENTHQLKTTHLHLYKQGFTSLAMDNYQLKNHAFPLSFHTPQKNNNPQLMTQQFGLKNVMLSYAALCICWVTLLPATQQNIITSGIQNHFNMHKNIVDIRNFTHTHTHTQSDT